MGAITEQTASSYIPMLGTELSQLPKLHFNKQIVDIATAVNCIGDAMELRLDSSDYSDAERATSITQQVLSTLDALKTNHEYLEAFAPLSKISNRVGENIINVFNVLRSSVKPEVEMLREQILAKTTEHLHNKDLSVLVTPEASINTDFYQIPWDDLMGEFGGASNILGMFKDNTKYDATMNVSDISIALNLLKYQIQDLSCHPDTKADIFERVTAKMTGDLSADHLEKAYALLTEQYTFSEFVVLQLAHTRHSNQYAEILHNNVFALGELYKAVLLFKSTPLNISDQMIEHLQSNIAVVEQVFQTIIYQVMTFRKFYSEALILDHRTINPDVLPSFLEKGNTLEDIARYLQVYFTEKQIPIPNNGISASTVEEQKADAEQQHAQLISGRLLQAASLRHTAMIQVAREILSDHIQAADTTRIPESSNIQEFYLAKKHLVSLILNRIDMTADNHLENSLYDFVIQLWYDGTIVQTAHELFGTEIVRQMDLVENLTSEDIALVDARVAATLAARFIVKELCIVE